MSLYKGNNLISGAMPNSANQSLSNLDSAGQDKFDEKVNKSGDTMTGLLNINSADGYYSGLQFQHPDYETGSIPANNLYFPYLKFVDTNERQVSEIYHTIRATGESNFVINSKAISDSGSDKFLIMSQKTDGSFVFTFPNTKCVDGQWIRPSSASVISSSTSVNGSTDLTYSIASIIPNDGYNYEVLFCCEGTTGTTSGNEVTLRISSDIVGNGDFCRAQTRTNSAVKCGGTMMLPVSTSRKIYVSRATSWNGSITNLWIIGYRRLGTNT